MTDPISIEFCQDKTSVLSKISINPSKTFKDLDIVCVIDESYSMSNLGSIKTNSDTSENTGLTILDIVKHAVKTIIEVLGPNDKLALVGFSTESRLIMPLTKMDENGKHKAKSETEKINVRNSTNIWAGLNHGLDILNESKHTNKYKTILLLTDGVPNVNPPSNDYRLAIRNHRSNRRGMRPTINTFGFGYSIDSQILKDITDEGNGMYSFIPDVSFVGTTFVNCLSNIKVTTIKDISVSIKNINNDRLQLYGHYDKISSYETKFNLITAQLGQTRDIVFEIKDCSINSIPEFDIIVKFNDFTTDINQFTIKSSEGTCVLKNDSIVLNLIRLKFLKMLNSLTRNYNKIEFNKNLSMCVKDIEHYKLSIENSSFIDRVNDILLDANGQVFESISKEAWFYKWGVHYLPSLSRAHLLQQCNNFKDPGIQNYGGELFEQIRDEIDDIFIRLPPPKASRQQPHGSYGVSQPSVSIRQLHSSSNPCFHGECNIKMNNNNTKQIKDIVKGDHLYTPNGEATVECVLRTNCHNSSDIEFVSVNNLVITPWHPIKNSDNIWIFPHTIGTPVVKKCDYIYSLVLSNGHIVEIEGTLCITLGHNITENDVITHPFLGTNKVIDDLQKNKDWNTGLITIEYNSLLRDENGLINGFIDF